MSPMQLCSGPWAPRPTSSPSACCGCEVLAGVIWQQGGEGSGPLDDPTDCDESDLGDIRSVQWVHIGSRGLCASILDANY